MSHAEKSLSDDALLEASVPCNFNVQTSASYCSATPPIQAVSLSVQEYAACAIIGGGDKGWKTNVPLAALFDNDMLLADLHHGLPLNDDHGRPVRLLVPKLFAWKTAKWVNRVKLIEPNVPGRREQADCHYVCDL